MESDLGEKSLFTWFVKLRRALFPSLAIIPKDSTEVAQKAVVQRIVRRYARGNLNLKRGRYVTAEQMEERKRRLANHSF